MKNTADGLTFWNARPSAPTNSPEDARQSAKRDAKTFASIPSERMSGKPQKQGEKAQPLITP